MPPKVKKEALIFIVNVGKNSSEIADGNKSFLERAKNIMKSMVERKLFICPKDEISIVCFGTDETKNTLHFPNITASEFLQIADWNMVKYILNLNSSEYSSTWPEGVHIACDIIDKQIEELGEVYMQKSIILIHNFKDDDDTMKQFDAKAVSCEIQQSQVQFLVIGQNPIEEMSEENLCLSEKLVLGVCKNTNGFYATLDCAENDVKFYGPMAVTPLGMKVILEYFDIKIPVAVYKTVDIDQKKPIFKRNFEKKINIIDDKMDIVSSDNLLSAVKFGHKLVTLTREDEAKMKYVGGPKGMKILGFVKKEDASIDLWAKSAARTILPSKDCNPSSVKQFYALAYALMQTEKVALVRLVLRDRDPPKVGFLFPQLEVDDQPWGFIWIEMPFEEQRYAQHFKPISKNFQEKVTPELAKAFDDLIESATLIDEDGDELFADGSVYNPTIQRMWNNISFRMLNPNQSLPDDNFLDLYKVLETPDHIKEKSKSCLENLHKLVQSVHEESQKKTTQEPTEIPENISPIEEKKEEAVDEFMQFDEENFLNDL